MAHKNIYKFLLVFFALAAFAYPKDLGFTISVQPVLMRSSPAGVVFNLVAVILNVHGMSSMSRWTVRTE